jgi:hypothetical protein
VKKFIGKQNVSKYKWARGNKLKREIAVLKFNRVR